MAESREPMILTQPHDRRELRLALQRLASGHYDRPEVLRAVARRIIEIEGIEGIEGIAQ